MNDHICSWCEQEFKVKVPGVNHGICRRHAEEQAGDMETIMKRANIPPEIIQQRLDSYRQRLPAAGASDMKKDGIPPGSVKIDNSTSTT